MGKIEKKVKKSGKSLNKSVEHVMKEELSDYVNSIPPGKSNLNLSSNSLKDDDISENVSPQKSANKKKKKKAAKPNSHSMDDSSVSVPETKEEESMIPSTEDILVEDQLLLECALGQVRPEDKSYQLRLDELNYEKIAEKFKNKSPEDCKEGLKLLIEKTPKTKCLHQVLEETLKEIPSEEVRKKNFNIFMKLNKDNIRDGIANGIGKDKIQVSSVLWHKLSADEKSLYKLDYKGSTIGKAPSDIFKEHYLSQHSDSDWKVARSKWQTIKEKKRLEYIAKSAQLKMKFDFIIKNLIEEGTDPNLLPSKVVCPSKSEVSRYLEHVQAPEPPPKLPALLYFKKMAEDDESEKKVNLFMALKVFRALSTEEQLKWTKKLKKITKRYEEDLENWKKDQPDFVVHMYEDKFFESHKEKKSKKQDIINSVKTLSMPVGNLKFSGEPVIPPLSAKNVYGKDEMRKNRKNVPMRELHKEFLALPEERKRSYEEKSASIKEAFVNALKSYVDNLHIEQRKLFLGCNRFRYIRALGEDIFESDYPSEIYPAYIGLEKKSSTASKKKRRYSSSDGASDEESSSPKLKQKRVSKDTKKVEHEILDKNLNESKSKRTLKRRSRASSDSDLGEKYAHSSPKKAIQTPYSEDDDDSEEAKIALNSWISSASATMSKEEQELVTDDSESDSS